jgi:phosphoesterase RecJ-like protein
MTRNHSTEEILEVIHSAERILVASHLRPDADALGSTLAMTLWLKTLGKDVTAWNEDGLPAKFAYLPEGHLLTAPPSEPAAFDLLIALDTSVKNRLGLSLSTAAGPPPILNIDHHVSNEGYGEWNRIDSSAPATGQILLDFLEEVGAEITPAIAANLFAAISTDTGSFQYRGVTPHTFRVAARLVEYGVDVAELSRLMYEEQPKRRLELLRHALNDAVFECGERSVSFTLKADVSNKLSLVPEDNEGIIDHLRAVEGVIVAAFFEELPDGMIRVSARSKDPRVDVCKICSRFGGGGHALASGARIAGSLEEVRNRFMQEVSHEIERTA